MLVLTPEANAEVRRNLLRAIGLMGGALLLFVILLAVAINPPGGTEGYRFASLLLFAFTLPVLVVAGTCLTLAYPMGCWPGFLRSRTLAALYGIDARDLTNQGMRRWMPSRSYWAAFARGTAVAFVFVGPWFFATWATSRRGFPEGYFFPSLLMLAYAGGLAGKAWVVRRLVAGCEGTARPESPASCVSIDFVVRPDRLQQAGGMVTSAWPCEFISASATWPRGRDHATPPRRHRARPGHPRRSGTWKTASCSQPRSVISKTTSDGTRASSEPIPRHPHILPPTYRGAEERPLRPSRPESRGMSPYGPCPLTAPSEHATAHRILPNLQSP